MDELIEHLQINLGKDFGYEDDVVVEKLRDVMHELRSSRLDYAGRYHSKKVTSNLGTRHNMSIMLIAYIPNFI